MAAILKFCFLDSISKTLLPIDCKLYRVDGRAPPRLGFLLIMVPFGKKQDGRHGHRLEISISNSNSHIIRLINLKVNGVVGITWAWFLLLKLVPFGKTR